MSDGKHDGFISVSLVRWMLKQIEKETDLSAVRGTRQPLEVGRKLIDRLERIDTLCEGFHERIDGEKMLLAEVMKWLFPSHFPNDEES